MSVLERSVRGASGVRVQDHGAPTTASMILARARRSRTRFLAPPICSNLIVALVLVVRPRLTEPKTLGVLRLPPPCAPVVALPSVGPYTLGAQGSAHVSTNYP